MHRPVALACVLLCVACGKDVEDPSFSSASATQTTGGSSSEDDGGTTTSGADTTVSTTASTTAVDTGGETTTSGGDSTTGGAAETGNGSCGDGVISPGEQCDGADLQNFDCMSLGLSGGTLSCDPMTCTFDTSMCMSTSGGTSS